VLAGGNYAWEHGHNPYEEDDGILLAKEISFMNLSKTQLVVLSACETGLGDINGSEGVMGLQRALKTAGVRYQVTTLWQVPDKETVEFMEAFYSEWLKGVSIEAAFITAQTTMMKKFPNSPFYWGAFVLYK
jgi:CHAT domain-containing protein